MRLWSRKKRAGTIELLFTLPVTPLEAVLGKFLAAWAFLGVAVLLSCPDGADGPTSAIPIGASSPRVTSAASLLAGGYLGVCSLTSAFTKTR